MAAPRLMRAAWDAILEQALEWRRAAQARSLVAHGALAVWRETAMRSTRRRSAAVSVAARRQAGGLAQWRRGLAQSARRGAAWREAAWWGDAYSRLHGLQRWRRGAARWAEGAARQAQATAHAASSERKRGLRGLQHWWRRRRAAELSVAQQQRCSLRRSVARWRVVAAAHAAGHAAVQHRQSVLVRWRRWAAARAATRAAAVAVGRSAAVQHQQGVWRRWRRWAAVHSALHSWQGQADGAATGRWREVATRAALAAWAVVAARRRRREQLWRLAVGHARRVWLSGGVARWRRSWRESEAVGRAAVHSRRAAVRSAWRQWRPRRAAVAGAVRLRSAARWGFERWAAAWRHQRETATVDSVAAVGALQLGGASSERTASGRAAAWCLVDVGLAAWRLSAGRALARWVRVWWLGRRCAVHLEAARRQRLGRAAAVLRSRLLEVRHLRVAAAGRCERARLLRGVARWRARGAAVAQTAAGLSAADTHRARRAVRRWSCAPADDALAAAAVAHARREALWRAVRVVAAAATAQRLRSGALERGAVHACDARLRCGWRAWSCAGQRAVASRLFASLALTWALRRALASCVAWAASRRAFSSTRVQCWALRCRAALDQWRASASFLAAPARLSAASQRLLTQCICLHGWAAWRDAAHSRRRRCEAVACLSKAAAAQHRSSTLGRRWRAWWQLAARRDTTAAVRRHRLHAAWTSYCLGTATARAAAAVGARHAEVARLAGGTTPRLVELTARGWRLWAAVGRMAAQGRHVAERLDHARGVRSVARWRRRALLLGRSQQLGAQAVRSARHSALRRGCSAWAVRARGRASDRVTAASHRATRLLAAWVAWRVCGARLHRSAVLDGATAARGARLRLRRGVTALRVACRAARWAPRHMTRYRLRTAMQAWLDAACGFAQGGGLAVVAAAAACLGARSRMAAAWARWRAWQAALTSSPSRWWQQRGLSCLRRVPRHAWQRWAREDSLRRCRHVAAAAAAQQRSTRRLAAALRAWAVRAEARARDLAAAQLYQSAELRRAMRAMHTLAAGRRGSRARGGALGSLATSPAHRLRRVRGALSRWEAAHHRQRARAWHRWQAERHAAACAQRGAVRRWAKRRQLRVHGAMLALSWRGERQRRALGLAIAAWRRQPLVALGRAALMAWIIRALRAAARRALIRWVVRSSAACAAARRTQLASRHAAQATRWRTLHAWRNSTSAAAGWSSAARGAALLRRGLLTWASATIRPRPAASAARRTNAAVHAASHAFAARHGGALRRCVKRAVARWRARSLRRRELLRACVARGLPGQPWSTSERRELLLLACVAQWRAWGGCVGPRPTAQACQALAVRGALAAWQEAAGRGAACNRRGVAALAHSRLHMLRRSVARWRVVAAAHAAGHAAVQHRQSVLVRWRRWAAARAATRAAAVAVGRSAAVQHQQGVWRRWRRWAAVHSALHSWQGQADGAATGRWREVATRAALAAWAVVAARRRRREQLWRLAVGHARRVWLSGGVARWRRSWRESEAVGRAAVHSRRAAVRSAWRQWRPRRAAVAGAVRLRSAARWGFERWAAAWRHQRETATVDSVAAVGALQLGGASSERTASGRAAAWCLVDVGLAAWRLSAGRALARWVRVWWLGRRCAVHLEAARRQRLGRAAAVLRSRLLEVRHLRVAAAGRCERARLLRGVARWRARGAAVAQTAAGLSAADTHRARRAVRRWSCAPADDALAAAAVAHARREALWRAVRVVAAAATAQRLRSGALERGAVHASRALCRARLHAWALEAARHAFHDVARRSGRVRALRAACTSWLAALAAHRLRRSTDSGRALMAAAASSLAATRAALRAWRARRAWLRVRCEQRACAATTATARRDRTVAKNALWRLREHGAHVHAARSGRAFTRWLALWRGWRILARPLSSDQANDRDATQ